MSKHYSLSSRIAGLIACCLLPISLSAQEWQGLQWTNGTEMLVAEQLNESQVLFVSNGFFDAGYGFLFDVKKTGETSYDLTSSFKPLTMPKDKSSIAYNILANDTFNGSADLHWKRKEVRGMDLLLSYNAEGKLTSMYTETSLDLREHAKDKITELFSGVYKDAQGRRWSFGTYDNECTWAGKDTHYEMDDALGVPDFAIKIDGKLYALVLTMKGMDIFEAQPDENGSFYKHIRQVASLTADDSTPRFADTSVHPCDSYAISLLKSDMLRLVRNEIYARHGWVFKDAKLNTYFRSQSWYEPLDDNSKVKLNEMELLNVSLLKYYEFITK